MECLRVKEEWFIITETYMKVNGMKEKEMGMEFWQKEMAITLRAIGWMIKEKVKALISIVIKTNFSLVNG